MQFVDVAIAIFTVMLWSANLIIIKFVSGSVPLEFFNFMRFLCCLPFLFFVKKPQVPLFKILLVTLFWYVLNFFFMGLGLHDGMGAGVVSVVYQTCGFFGVLFCYVFLQETPKAYQVMGMLLAFIGIVLLFHESFANNISSVGLVYILLAAVCWGVGIALIKKYRLAADFSTNVWLASIAIVPMGGMIFLRGGQQAFVASVQTLSPLVILEIIFAALGPTLLAGCLWFRLLKKYPNVVVTPFIFLLPAFSCIGSYYLLDERFSLLQIFSFGIILLGILLNQNLIKYGPFNRYSQKLWKKLTLTS